MIRANDPDGIRDGFRADHEDPGAARGPFHPGGGFHSRPRIRARRTGHRRASANRWLCSTSPIRSTGRSSRKRFTLTPSREPAAVQQAIFRNRAARGHGAGLTSGPVHAEMRVNEAGVWMLEVAARPIGGLCSRVLRFDSERVARGTHPAARARRRRLRQVRLAPGAHGVMMIPIPTRRRLPGVDGLERRALRRGYRRLVITAKEGPDMLPAAGRRQLSWDSFSPAGLGAQQVGSSPARVPFAA